LPHSSGWDEENLQPQGGENDEPNPPRKAAPDSNVGAGIQGNEKADQHAKAALQGKTNKNYKTVAEDWKNWIREKQEGIRQAEWTSSENPMVTVKPRIKENNGTQALTRKDQVTSDSPTGTRCTLIHRLNMDIMSLG
jgi:hypothetical protein